MARDVEVAGMSRMAGLQEAPEAAENGAAEVSMDTSSNVEAPGGSDETADAPAQSTADDLDAVLKVGSEAPRFKHHGRQYKHNICFSVTII